MKNLRNPQISHPITAFLIFLMLLFTVSCAYYRASKTSPGQLARYVDPANSNKQKFYYLHDNEQVVQLTDLQFKGVHLSAQVVPDSLIRLPIIPDYKTRRSSRLKSDNKAVLQEVHIYLGSSQRMELKDSIQLDASELASIEFITHDGGKEIMSGVLSASLVVLLGVILFTPQSEPDPAPTTYYAGSCPYVYSFDGEEFVFESEAYTGALFQSLERADYLPLYAIQASENEYIVRLKNKVQEREFTNFTELIIAYHPEGSNVVLDKNGTAYPISKPEAPIKAISAHGESFLKDIHKKDQYYYTFDDVNSSEQELLVSFKKPADAQECKLLLNSKNTVWGDHVVYSFLSKFGNGFDQWQEQEEARSTEDRILDFIKWEFPITVSVKKGTTWHLADYVFPVGPLGIRDIVVPIDLKDHHEDLIEIKLSTGFQFWTINQVAMDFSKNQRIEIEKLLPVEAKHAEKTALQSLLYDDKTYQKMEYGDHVDLHYKQPKVQTDQHQSIFLHTKGYYEYVMQSTHEPDMEAIAKFVEPGYFSDFSKMLYQKQLKELEVLVSKQ